MTGEILKSFLVGLGFDVDEQSLSKFNKAIGSATVKITALYASVKVMAAAVVYGISQVSESFEQMGYEYRIIAPMINKALVLRRELLKAYSSAGVNITDVIRKSVLLNMSLTKTKFAFKAIYDSVASRFFTTLTKQSDLFRQKIYQNMPKIQNALERFVKFVFKALEATTALGVRVWSILTRVYDFFEKLHKATDGWSTIILGVVAAWKLLNLSFLATPLGMILTGLVAILALYDDFKTFQEGGKSLFDWTAAIPMIEAFTQTVEALANAWRDLVDIVLNFSLAIYRIFKGDYSGAFDAIKDSLNGFLLVLKDAWDVLRGMGGQLGGLGQIFSSLFSGTKDFNPANAQPLGSQGHPLGVNNQSNTNQNVNQQTTISVQGSADAKAVGKAVAGEQGRVNFDMVRNMKGATR